MSRPHTLYLCYFGIREPLVQTQVLPYLREIMKGGVDASILTFEPARGAWEAQVEANLAAEGITWHRLKYHKRPSVPATLFDIANGVAKAIRINKIKKVDVFHPRGHLPAPIGAIARNVCGGKLLFDIRGFMPEEYVDAGIWDASSTVYKTFKRVEKWLMKQSDGFVVLTEKARELLFPESSATGLDSLGRPVEVIPCCVDLSLYADGGANDRHRMRTELGVDGRHVVAYVGSFDGFYLTEEIFDFIETCRRQDPTTFAMILTQRSQEKLVSVLRNRGFTEEDFLVRGVQPGAIPRFLSAADVAISFIKPTFSKQSSSPTKIAEYLAAGLPVISNEGVGDLDALIEFDHVGALVRQLNEQGYSDAINGVRKLGDIRDRCKRVAVERFDLGKMAGVRYRRLYQHILAEN